MPPFSTATNPSKRNRVWIITMSYTSTCPSLTGTLTCLLVLSMQVIIPPSISLTCLLWSVIMLPGDTFRSGLVYSVMQNNNDHHKSTIRATAIWGWAFQLPTGVLHYTPSSTDRNASSAELINFPTFLHGVQSEKLYDACLNISCNLTRPSCLRALSWVRSKKRHGALFWIKSGASPDPRVGPECLSGAHFSRVQIL